jgi:competence protein ComEA
MFKIIIGVIVATLVALIAFSIVENVSGGIVDTSTSTSHVSSYDALTVTISGEVQRPGTYLVSLDSTLADLLLAASGATSNADARAYNTDYILENKQSFYIAPLYDNSDACALTPISKVDINTGDKASLMKIGSIGTTLATAIIDYRDTNGSYERIEDLKNVSGIGSATFEKVKNYVILFS